eukprot:Gb_01774 [translate_table: standard]
MNPPEMDTNYPDSVDSSPRSRETDSDFGGNHRWEDNSGSRVRLMCSYGGKIIPRPHDNQLSYVGGDTRILAVDRNIKFSSMIAKLSGLWGSSVSFKYQLPNEDLDALISVTNDEDLENMMAEYDRLQKSGYKFSRLRLFIFSNKPESTSSLGSLLQDSKREHWFVDALNVGPGQGQGSGRSEAFSAVQGMSEASAWVNNMPDYLFGLDHGIEDDRGLAHKAMANPNSHLPTPQEVQMAKNRKFNVQPDEGIGQQQQPLPSDIQSAPNSPMVGYSSYDSNSSAPARINAPAPQFSESKEKPGISQDQAVGQEKGNFGHYDKPRDTNLDVRSGEDGLRTAVKTTADSPTAQEIGIRTGVDRAPNTSPQQQYAEIASKDNRNVPIPVEVAKRRQDVVDNQRQIPIQEFQKLQIQAKQQQQQHEMQELQRSAEEIPSNLPGRKYPAEAVRVSAAIPPTREVLTNQEMRPIQPEIYMQKEQPAVMMHHPQQTQSDYYMAMQQQEQTPQYVQQGQTISYWQMHDPMAQHPHPHSHSHSQLQHQPQHGEQSAIPVYFVPAGSPMLQTMTSVRPTGQASGGYYPVQRVNAPMVYSAEVPSSNPVTTVRATAPIQRQTAPEVTDPYRDQIPIPQQVPKVPMYAGPPAGGGGVASAPVASDARMMYRPSQPPPPAAAVPMPVPSDQPYSYQHVMYEPNPRQVYYTQAAPVVNPQYQGMAPLTTDMHAPSDMPSDQQVKLARVSQPS